jgi:hypothetical protein
MGGGNNRVWNKVPGRPQGKRKGNEGFFCKEMD